MAYLKGNESEVTVPARAEIIEPNGRFKTYSFRVKFHRYPYSEAKEYMRRVREDELSDQDLVRMAMIEWIDLPGDGGNVEFTPENLEEFLQEKGYVDACVDAFGMAQFNVKASARKN